MAAEPESGTGAETEPESEVEVSVAPETEPESEAENAIGIAAEPAPDWDKAFKTWSHAWGIHVYGFGTLYAVLTIACVCVIIRSYRRKQGNVAYCTCVRVLLAAFGVLRCLCLYIDAYNANGTLPSLAYTLMWILGEPCFMSAFTIYFLVLREATQFRPGRKKFRVNQTRFLFGVFSVHFVLAVGSPIVFYYTIKVGTVLQIICGAYYLVVGAGTIICFAYLARKLHGPFNRMRTGKIQKTTLDKDKKVLMRILLHIYFMIISGVLICVLHLYGLLGVYGVVTDGDRNNYVQPWPWWAYQTAARILELFVAFVLFQAVNNNQKTKRKVQGVKSRLLDSNSSPLTSKENPYNTSTADAKPRSGDDDSVHPRIRKDSGGIPCEPTGLTGHGHIESV